MKNLVENTNLLKDVFGKTPSFHDSEVVEVRLKRKYEGENCPTLVSLIQIKNYQTGDTFIVKIIFKNIFGLKLENFNHQNVISNLFISDFSDEFFSKTKEDERLIGLISEAEINRLSRYVKFEYCFGIEMEFLCREIILNSVKLVTHLTQFENFLSPKATNIRA